MVFRRTLCSFGVVPGWQASPPRKFLFAAGVELGDETLCSLACGFNLGGLLPLCSRTTGICRVPEQDVRLYVGCAALIDPAMLFVFGPFFSCSSQQCLWIAS